MSEDGTGGTCADGRELNDPAGVAVSRDGRNVYVVSNPFGGAVAVFARDRSTGALTQLPGTDGCVSVDGTGGECAEGRGLENAYDVAVSDDGKYVYVVSRDSDAVAVFARDRGTGALTQLSGTDGCISLGGTGGECADGSALDGATSVTVSRDRENVYATSLNSRAVAVFARDRQTGALTQLPGTDGCVSEDGTGGECAEGVALESPIKIAVSRDGENAYVVSGGVTSVAVVAVFARD